MLIDKRTKVTKSGVILNTGTLFQFSFFSSTVAQQAQIENYCQFYESITFWQHEMLRLKAFRNIYIQNILRLENECDITNFSRNRIARYQIKNFSQIVHGRRVVAYTYFQYQAYHIHHAAATVKCLLGPRDNCSLLALWHMWLSMCSRLDKRKLHAVREKSCAENPDEMLHAVQTREI